MRVIRVRLSKRILRDSAWRSRKLQKMNGKGAAELSHRTCIMIEHAQIIICCKSLEMPWIEIFINRIIRSPERPYFYTFVSN